MDIPSWDELVAMPTLCVGQADDLKIDTGDVRVWTSRCGLADGERWERTIFIEQYVDGCWEETGAYEG